MSDKTAPRPTQATLASWLVISGSVFLVTSLFSTVGALRSLETRRAIEEFLATSPGSDLGIGVQEAVTILHALSLVAGGCAAAMAVLGVYTFKPNKQARLGLSILAVPLLVAGVLTGGILASFVAVAVVLLWLQPTRDWFDGKAAPTAPRETPVGGLERRPEASSSPSSPGPAEQSGSSDMPRPWGRPVQEGEGSTAAPYQGFGQGTTTLTRPADGEDPYAGQHGYGQPAERGKRPAAVLIACLSTWVLSALVGGLLAVSVLGLLSNPEALVDEVRSQQPGAFEQSGLTTQTLVTSTVVLCSILALWALAASVLASFAFRGANGARVGLIVSAAVVAVLSLLAGILAPLLLPIGLGAAVTVYGLLRPEVRAWYAARPARRS